MGEADQTFRGRSYVYIIDLEGEVELLRKFLSKTVRLLREANITVPHDVGIWMKNHKKDFVDE